MVHQLTSGTKNVRDVVALSVLILLADQPRQPQRSNGLKLMLSMLVVSWPDASAVDANTLPGDLSRGTASAGLQGLMRANGRNGWKGTGKADRKEAIMEARKQERK